MDLISQLRRSRLLAIVRGTDPDAALMATATLLHEGVELVEISLNTPSAIDLITRVSKELPEGAAIGCGTALRAEDVDRALAAGASFVVTPAIGPAVDRAIDLGAPVLAGAFTPTEIREAHAAGATGIKLFPASTGGPGHLRALRDPFPSVHFVPVGGVDAADAPVYLRYGAAAVGVGTPLVGDAASGGSLDELRDRIHRFLDVVGKHDG